mgnify:CR=1 FL=1
MLYFFILRRIIMVLVIFDNFIINLIKKVLGSRWILTGKCQQCGTCCQQIVMTMTPAQVKSRFFTDLSIRWISWLFGFQLQAVDEENCAIIFGCQHLTPDNKCGNYRWRPNVCRNFPLVDYFAEPKLLPNCGFRAKLKN